MPSWGANHGHGPDRRERWTTMPALTKVQFVEMLHRSAQIIDENHVALSELDGELGDGDHGVTILRTMKAVTARGV